MKRPDRSQLAQQLQAATFRLTAPLLTALVMLLAAALSVSPAMAAPLAAGQPLPGLATTDQHERPWRVEPTTRTLLFAADKVASDLVIDLLKTQGADALAARQAVFLADIHAMPGLITRMFALPALRELPFPVGLGREAVLAADLPRKKGHVTVVTLKAGQVETLHFLATDTELRQALSLPAR
jgi:hypothetical protein